MAKSTVQGHVRTHLVLMLFLGNAELIVDDSGGAVGTDDDAVRAEVRSVGADERGFVQDADAFLREPAAVGDGGDFRLQEAEGAGPTRPSGPK